MYNDTDYSIGSIKWSKFILISFAIWSVISLLISVRYNIYELSQGKEVLWAHVIFFNFNSAVLWALLTPLLLILTRRIFLENPPWYLQLLIHGIFAVLLVPLHTILFLYLDYQVQNMLGLWQDLMTFSQYLRAYSLEIFVEGLITYGILVLLLYGYLLYLKNEKMTAVKNQMEKNLIQTSIQNLKYQLQPHFLFNGMQTISNLIRKDPEVAQKAVTGLSDILRFSIDQLKTDFITVAEETDIATKYLDFQKLRFGEKIRYTIICEENCLQEKVPAMMLQPLVENSIKHGYGKTGQAVDIHIQIYTTSHQLIVNISDTGPGLEGKIVYGTGLRNLKNRLEHFYKKEYQLSIDHLDKGFGVTIKLPFSKSHEQL